MEKISKNDAPPPHHLVVFRVRRKNVTLHFDVVNMVPTSNEILRVLRLLEFEELKRVR